MTELSFEELYQTAPCGHLAMDGDDVIVTVNETFLQWSGYSREQVIGARFLDLLVTSSKLFYETRFQSVLRLGGEAREVALELARADGSRMPILINAKLVAFDDGAASIRVAIFDSTERQDYERELLNARRLAEISEVRVRTLQHASIAFLASDSEESLAGALVDISREAFAASDAAVVLYNEIGSLRVVAGEHLLKTLLALQAARTDESDLPSEDVVAIGSLREAHEISPEIANILRSIRAEAVSVAPLIGGQGRLGAVALFYGRSRTFDEPTYELHRALARQASLVLDRIRLQGELEQMALHDQLTGLANRNLLRERLSHTIAYSDRSRRPMSLIFMDLDGFKAVNDELGHRVGDAVLQTVAARINSVVREADIVGRFGGDEFLIVCEDADQSAAMRVAERVVEVISKPMDEIDGGRQIRASIGVAVFHPGDRPVPTNDAIVRAADAAMYRSKNAGPGRITVVSV
jgi:diguanylate cyclase (GGDEF)-like protein/PAS domain S-box-containing protein